ncbi:Mce-associated membrane protein [Streptosporangium becharense]|uniref:Mce-associated membrane protein n=1 Tax=Streptosporangium becharense TaxID=1816182 RepID=A0A7W9IFY6_9ACTN|nr:hypothetical protein [Streptosporangium becharense]MBB2909422.1 Mce-associated membrane protein [Streptosporangium becharense]MBB5819621.1 Mce-associated membrane protein [Streptosporangium becharense]
MALHAARPRPPLKTIAAALIVLIVALGGTALWAGSLLREARAEADDRQAAMRAAGTHAVRLLSVSHRSVDTDLERILDSSTGAARAEYTRTAADLRKSTLEDKVVQMGALRACGLVSMKDGMARVMVVADAVVRWEGAKGAGKAPQALFYRWNMEVTKVSKTWLVSKAELVL